MSANQPIISIVTPVFNRAAIVHKTIDSVIGQTYQNWELLLVDDGSTENIDEIIKSKYSNDPRISFTKRTREPKSASTCRNIGAENAKGDYLIFLDSDDWLEPFCLEQRVKVMVSDPDLDFAVFPFRFLSHDGKYLPNNFDNAKDPLINFLSNKSYWAIMCPIWKRQFFFEIGGFNANFRRYQDVEIHIRALINPGGNYKMCLNLEADTIIIPSAKKQSFDFALDVFESLSLLIPQTYDSLKKAKKIEHMKYMDGYLKEWLVFFAFTNFNDAISKKADEILILFRKYKVISSLKMKVYRNQIKVVGFAIKLLKYIYIKLVY